MNIDTSVLKKNLLFRTKSDEEILSLLSRIRTIMRSCGKNELIVTEGEPATLMGLVLSGTVEVQKIFSTGKTVTVSRFSGGSTFGEAVIFSKTNVYPATVVSVEPSTILLFPKQELLKLFTLDMEIMGTFMQNMSERLVLLNQKIEILSLGTLRQRIAHYLLKESKKQKTERITLPFNKRVWAEHLNSARPSLSRELIYLRDNGYIEFEGDVIQLLKVDALEALLE
ncbi:Crp/Fnr family transcriptional regulator [Gorillibacterium sp. sgz5001074]|uniref:Crp/Fnr family transcriptional regulator n=1 Tax=Gorillibacterium sp. sgz5001074 TaxID=3446695 RepID=UPI003F66ADF4